MSTTRAQRFWGGVKIPFSPALYGACSVQAVVQYVAPPAVAPNRMPQVYWRNNIQQEKVLCPVGSAFTLTLPALSQYVEFFLEYSTERVTEVTKQLFAGTVQVSLDAGIDNEYLAVLGQKTYQFTIQRVGTRQYNYPYPYAGSALAFSPALAAYWQSFRFAQVVVRAQRITMLDAAGVSIDAGGSEAAMQSPVWSEIPAGAPWPLFSSGSNLYGDGLPPEANFLVETTKAADTNSAWEQAPCTGGVFIVPAFSTGFRLRRLCSKGAVPNALAAAKAIDPLVTVLYDRMVFACEDAGIHSPSFAGRDNRIVPQRHVAVEYFTGAL